MVSRSLPFEYFVLDRARADGAAIAQINGSPVPAAVIDANGRRYLFAGLARHDRAGRIDVLSLKENEWLVQPNLIYRAD